MYIVAVEHSRTMCTATLHHYMITAMNSVVMLEFDDEYSAVVVQMHMPNGKPGSEANMICLASNVPLSLLHDRYFASPVETMKREHYREGHFD
jgi:hypothetical protein